MDTKDARKHTVVFYNVENLYDTIDDKGVRDSDFTPEGEKNWTIERLSKKLTDLASAIGGISKKHPVVIGLTEVENRGVATQLMKTSPLRDHNYKLVHQDSPDNRGIDVCLFYDQEYVKYLSHEYLRLVFPWNHDIKTRDVLFFECEINGEEFWFVVNHWPSRGSNNSEKKREFVAKCVRQRLNQVMARNSGSKIIVMGDFNDEPSDISLLRHLDARHTKNIDDTELYNLANEHFEQGKGSCVYEGGWLMIDQFNNSMLVSQRYPHNPYLLSTFQVSHLHEHL